VTLVLASASPRRAELLRQIGVQFLCLPVDIDETVRVAESARDYVLRLAQEKAQAGFARHGDPSVWSLGSDTTVTLGGEILGKPLDHDDAVAMLHRLSGQHHQVMTAVALVGADGCRSAVVVTDVTFRPLTHDQIEAYCVTGEPMDKAGGYGIQGMGGVFVESIHGSYSSVVGLPLAETAQLLAEAGLAPWHNWPDHRNNSTEARAPKYE